MIVRCQHCGKRYRLKEFAVEKYQHTGFKCKACQHIVLLNNLKKRDFQNNNLQPLLEIKPKKTNFPDKYQNKSNDNKNYQQRVKWNKSIQFKFSIILSVVIVFILLIFTTITTFTIKKRITNELNQLAENTAERMSKSMIAPLWELDETQAEENIFSEMLDKKIFGILIQDNDINAIFQGGKRDKRWHIQQTKESFSGDLISAVEPIKKDNELLGTVEVYVSKKYMYDESFRSIRNLVITTLILIFSILITTLLTMKRIIIRPLSYLRKAAEQISLGDLQAEIEHQTEDEVGHLASALDRMRESLKIAFSRYEKRNQYR